MQFLSESKSENETSKFGFDRTNLYNLVYGKTGLFHYMQISKIFYTTKFIRQSVDKYIADAYGQSIYKIILY